MITDIEIDYKFKVLEFVKDYTFSKVSEERSLLTAEYYGKLASDKEIPLPSNLPEYLNIEDILRIADVINNHLGL